MIIFFFCSSANFEFAWLWQKKILAKQNTQALFVWQKNHNMPKDTNSHGAIEGDNERSRHKPKYDNNK